jgi:hypothetical protein
MKYYAGLDVSVKETSLCIVDEAGRICREMKVVSHPDVCDGFCGRARQLTARMGRADFRTPGSPQTGWCRQRRLLCICHSDR